jgi:hypothetical protein
MGSDLVISILIHFKGQLSSLTLSLFTLTSCFNIDKRIKKPFQFKSFPREKNLISVFNKGIY